MKGLVPGVLVALSTALTLLLPSRRPVEPAAVPPQWAAAHAEATVPALGLLWGKVRGWQRRDEGWVVIWQPAHGAWTVRAWVADDGSVVRHQLDVAPWLPGAKLSRDAALLVAGAAGQEGSAEERLGRRDWEFASSRLVGAARAGPGLGPRPVREADPWLALLIGLALAGAVSRSVLPCVPSRGWRRMTLAAAFVLLCLVPWLTPVGARFCKVGVRPWIVEATVGAVAAVVLVGFAVGTARYPVMSGKPAAWWTVPAALTLGGITARVWPMPLTGEVASSPVRLPAFAALAVVVGWVVTLAADGLREISSFAGPGRNVFLSLLAGAAVAAPSPSLALVVGACVTASRRRGEGAWVGLAVAWGWVIMSLATTCSWPEAGRDAIILVVASWGGATVLAAAARPRIEDTVSPQTSILFT